MMEETLSDAIHKYCGQRRHQLNSIDEMCFAGGDTMTNELRNLRITDKFPILNEWVETLTRATSDLIKTIKDVEQTMLNEDERMANASAQQQSNDESKHGAREPVRRNKSKNKILTKNSENNHSISRNSPAARLLLSSDELNGNDGAVAVAAAAAAVTSTVTTDRDMNSIGFCKSLLKRMFAKGKCEEGAASRPDPDVAYRNGRINNIEFVYVDKSLCCMSTIINEKLSNTTPLTNAETVYADFKATCADRMQILQNVTTAFQTSLHHQEALSAQQLQEIEQLQAQIKRLKKYRRTNRMLEANIKSICAENAHLLVEAKKIETSLRLLRKRQPDNDDHGTLQ